MVHCYNPQHQWINRTHLDDKWTSPLCIQKNVLTVPEALCLSGAMWAFLQSKLSYTIKGVSPYNNQYNTGTRQFNHRQCYWWNLQTICVLVADLCCPMMLLQCIWQQPPTHVLNPYLHVYSGTHLEGGKLDMNGHRMDYLLNRTASPGRLWGSWYWNG